MRVDLDSTAAFNKMPVKFYLLRKLGAREAGWSLVAARWAVKCKWSLQTTPGLELVVALRTR